MTRLQRAIVFSLAACWAAMWLSFALTVADAPLGLHYLAGAVCLLVAAGRTAFPPLPSARSRHR